MQIPNKGQPIDYSYFTEIVNNINSLQSTTTTKSSISEGPGNTAEAPHVTQSTQNVVLFTSYISLTNDDTTKAHTQSTTIKFNSVSFLKPPVVTLTPVSSTAQSTPEKVVLGVSNITQSGCTINMNFLDKDIPSIGINIIAIGLPVV